MKTQIEVLPGQVWKHMEHFHREGRVVFIQIDRVDGDTVWAYRTDDPSKRVRSYQRKRFKPNKIGFRLERAA